MNEKILSFAPLRWPLFGILYFIFLGKNYIVLAKNGSALSGYKCYHSINASVDSLLDKMVGITITVAVLLIISVITMASIPIGASRLERDINIGIGAILNLVVSGIMMALSVFQFVLPTQATKRFADNPRIPLLWILFGGSFFLLFVHRVFHTDIWTGCADNAGLNASCLHTPVRMQTARRLI